MGGCQWARALWGGLTAWGTQHNPLGLAEPENEAITILDLLSSPPLLGVFLVLQYPPRIISRGLSSPQGLEPLQIWRTC